MIGFSFASISIQPSSRASGTYTGAKKSSQEDRHLHQRSCLDRPEAHRDAAGPEQPGDVDEKRERVHAEDVDRPAEDVHARDERDDREQPSPVTSQRASAASA